MLTDYHVHLRPDELAATAEDYFTPANAERYLEAAAATARSVAAAPAAEVVSTQGHALRVDDLASTLVVEATLHHADLVVHLDAPGPPPVGLDESRRVVEALLGRTLDGWSTERVVMVGTGRAEPTVAERDTLAGLDVPVFS